MDTSSQKLEKNGKKKSNIEIIIQIYLPLGLFIFVFLLLCVLVAVGSSSGSSPVAHWANISVMFISIPVIIFLLIFIVFLAVLIFGQAKLIRWIPFQLNKLYLLVLKVSLWVWDFTQKLTQPPIKIKSSIYGIKHGLRLKKNIKD